VRNIPYSSVEQKRWPNGELGFGNRKDAQGN